MDKEEFEISKKDQELSDILESKEEFSNNNDTSIDVKIPKDKNYKKGLAFATAAILGTSGIAATALKAKHSSAEAVKRTEDVIYENYEYDDSMYGQELPYINSDRILKTSFDYEESSYVQVFATSAPSKKHGEFISYDFNTPEYSRSLYIPETDIITYIPLDINTDNPTAECTNFRISPSCDNDNISRKIEEGGRVYIKPGPVKRKDDECWFEAIYPEEESLLTGYYCVVDSEKEKRLVSYNTNDEVFYYAYVPDKTRLYSKDEILNMYYIVIENDGLPFVKEAGNYDDFSYLPYGSIVQGTTNTDIKTSKKGDPYAWIQCIAEVDGEKHLGYIPYRKAFANPVIKRVPPEELHEIGTNKLK